MFISSRTCSARFPFEVFSGSFETGMGIIGCVVCVSYSVPKKEQGSLTSLSMMTVMKICPSLERKRRGRAVAVNRMGKKRRVRERRRRGGGS